MYSNSRIEVIATEMKVKRVSLKLSQGQVAEKLGINKNYYSQIESGCSNKPSEEVLLKIANFYELDSDRVLWSFDRIASDIINGLLYNPDYIKKLRTQNVVYPLPQVANETIYNEAVNYE